MHYGSKKARVYKLIKNREVWILRRLQLYLQARLKITTSGMIAKELREVPVITDS